MLLSSKILQFEKAALINKDTVFSYSQFKQLVEKNKTLMNLIRGCSVSLDCNDSFSIAILLCILERTVSDVLLLPSDINDKQKSDFEKSANTEFRLNYIDGVIVLKTLKTPRLVAAEVAVTNWIIPTSGTTGTPKLVVHNIHSLTRSLKKNIAKGGSIIWGVSFEVSRFAGLQVYLQGILTGSTLCFAGDRTSVIHKLDFFIQNNVNSISATPSFWRQLLSCPEVGKIKLKNITLGGEIADQSLLNTLSKRFPDSRITHIYASTEAGVGFNVTDKLAGFPYCYVSEGLPNLFLRIQSGKLFVKHAGMNQSYLDNSSLIGDDGFIDTGDLVEVINDRVYFLGRESGTINVGGNKIIPEEVEAVLLGHTNVARCRVYGKSSSILGNLVSAEIQMIDVKQDFRQLKQELTLLCKTKLAKHKVPRFLSIIEEVELNATGKIIR